MSDTGPRDAARSRLFTEWVWLPSYAGVAFVAVGAFGLKAVGIFLALLGTRAFLEVLYRVVFGSSRLSGTQQIFTFLLQTLVWLAVWGLHAQASS